MTTTIYIRARDPDNGARVVDELLVLGIPRDRLEVYGRHIPAGVSVSVKPWRGGTRPLVPAALVGAASLPALAALTLVGREASVLFVLALVGASAGVMWARHRLHDAHSRFGSQQQALDRGDLMIVADLDQSDVQRVEAYVAERHPEVLLLGPDPDGSPPFP